MKIILADERKEVRAALHFALKYRHNDWNIIETDGANPLEQQIADNVPDLLILGLNVPVSSASIQAPIQLIWQPWFGSLHRACPTLKIMAMVNSPEWIFPAFEAGSDAAICKADPIETVENAIQQLFIR